MDRRELRLLIKRYFHLGFENQVILDFLKNRHGTTITLSTLKRRLRDYGLKRRGAQIEDQELREILLREILWTWAASRVQSSVALSKIKASHSCAQGKGC